MGRKFKYTIGDMYKLAYDIGLEKTGVSGKFLSEEYFGIDKKHKWECGKCGKIWDARSGDIKNKKSWCPQCSNKRKGNHLNLKIGEMKKCPKCNNIYPFTIDYFFRNELKKYKLDYYCKKCRTEINNEYKNHVKKLKEINNYSIFKSYYGITIEEYDKMLEEQNTVCWICGSKEIAKNKYGNIKKLAIDHNHKTGKIRGCLCTKCNIGLGYFKDNPLVLIKAAKYLLKNSSS